MDDETPERYCDWCGTWMDEREWERLEGICEECLEEGEEEG